MYVIRDKEKYILLKQKNLRIEVNEFILLLYPKTTICYISYFEKRKISTTAKVFK
jgi:hypothetical protein